MVPQYHHGVRLVLPPLYLPFGGNCRSWELLYSACSITTTTTTPEPLLIFRGLYGRLGQPLPALRRSCSCGALTPLERSTDFVWQEAECRVCDSWAGVGLSPAMLRLRLESGAVAGAVLPHVQYRRVAICGQQRLVVAVACDVNST